MLVESGNPAHSLADSPRMREALLALDLLVVIDVAMTETARLAHYVLPAASQFEKWEATFFNFDFPRERLPPPPPAARAAAGHARRARDPRAAVRGARRASPRTTSHRCAKPRSRVALRSPLRSSPRRRRVRSSGASRRCCSTARSGRRCPATRRPPRCCGARRTAARRATRRRSRGPASAQGSKPARRCSTPSSSPVRARVHGRRAGGVLARLRTDDGKVHLAVEELLAELAGLSTEVPPRRDPRSRSCCRPASGARSPPTRSSATRRGARRDGAGALRISPVDAARLGVVVG